MGIGGWILILLYVFVVDTRQCKLSGAKTEQVVEADQLEETGDLGCVALREMLTWKNSMEEQ